MKINEPNRIGALNPYQKQNESRISETNKSKKKDEVQISAAAKELATSQASSAERAKQLEELKQAVSTGTYHVEAGKIAEKLFPYLNNNQSE